MYLDYAATAPISLELKKYLISILDDYGNPSSTYELGRKTKNIISEARENVRKFINAESDNNIVFTSSGSASNSIAILGLTNVIKDYYLLYSPIAHKSMRLACKSIKYNHELTVDNNGQIDIEILDEKLKQINKDEYIPIVCLDVANSEIGIIQDLENIITIIHKYNGYMIADFTGYIPSYKVDVQKLNVDIATFSGHKLGSLKGIGVLYKKDNIKLNPLIFGSQEQGLFGGTESVVNIASLGFVVNKYNYDYTKEKENNRNYLYNEILNNIFNCYLIGKLSNRLCGNLYMCFRNVDSQSLVALLDKNGYQVSTGSACNNGDINPSYTLKSIGIPLEDINSCIRISLNGKETKEDLDKFVKTLKDNVALLRL